MSLDSWTSCLVKHKHLVSGFVYKNGSFISYRSYLDGVLEIRNEKIHTVALSRKQGSKDVNSFGLILCGRIDVRVRRDSDVQMVLAHVYNKLSQLIGQLTIQVICCY